ncbi:LysR family transcriptional regulator [Sphingomonas sp. I4]
MSDDRGPPQQILRRLNLNLLYALAAILRAPTLTEAGRMIALSQPAMSMALRRLRENFDDPLVVYRHGERRLTALGEALRPRIMRIMREAGDVLDLRLDFDPATTSRVIVIAAPQEIELMLLRTTIPSLLRQAPGLRVELVPFNYSSVEALFERGVDLAILPGRMVNPTLPVRPLFEMSHTAMVCRDHPSLGDRMTVEQYLNGRHVALSEDMEDGNMGIHDHPLLARRNVLVRTSMYAMLPALVERTDLIATVASWSGQYYASTMPIRLIPMPGELSPMPVAAQWPVHLDGAPYLEWVLDALKTGIEWHGLLSDRFDHQCG